MVRGRPVEAHCLGRLVFLGPDVGDGLDGVGHRPVVAEIARDREGVGDVLARGLQIPGFGANFCQAAGGGGERPAVAHGFKSGHAPLLQRARLRQVALDGQDAAVTTQGGDQHALRTQFLALGASFFEMDFGLGIISLVAFRKAEERLHQRGIALHAERLVENLRRAVVPERLLVAVLRPREAGATEFGLGADGGRNLDIGAAEQQLKLLVALGQITADFPVTGQRARDAQAQFDRGRLFHARAQRAVEVGLLQREFFQPLLLVRAEKMGLRPFREADKEIEMPTVEAGPLVMLQELVVGVVPDRFQHGVPGLAVGRALDEQE